MLGVVHVLGWRSDPFAEVDRRIEERPRYERDDGRLDRYGKKHGWIGFYTVTGMLADRGQHPEWLEVDIDPDIPAASAVGTGAASGLSRSFDRVTGARRAGSLPRPAGEINTWSTLRVEQTQQ